MNINWIQPLSFFHSVLEPCGPPLLHHNHSYLPLPLVPTTPESLQAQIWITKRFYLTKQINSFFKRLKLFYGVFQKCDTRGSMFWIHLDMIEKLGAVLFKLYGQACDKCGSDDKTTFYPRCGIRIRSSRHWYVNFQNVYFINNDGNIK